MEDKVTKDKDGEDKDIATKASRSSIKSLSQLAKAVKMFVNETKLDENPNKDKAFKGVLGLAFLWFVFGHGVHILQNMVGKVYPAYRSVQALVNPLPECDNIGDWLTYWVVFAIFTLGDFWLNIFIGWLPIYGISKVVVLCWLVAGSQPKGAQIVYHKIVWPFFNKHRDQIDKYAGSVNAKAGEIMNMAVETAKDVAAEQQLNKE